jgi:hypothetical protein
MKAALMLAASRIGFIDFLLQEQSQEAEVLGLRDPRHRPSDKPPIAKMRSC